MAKLTRKTYNRKGQPSGSTSGAGKGKRTKGRPGGTRGNISAGTGKKR